MYQVIITNLTFVPGRENPLKLPTAIVIIEYARTGATKPTTGVLKQYEMSPKHSWATTGGRLLLPMFNTDNLANSNNKITPSKSY